MLLLATVALAASAPQTVPAAAPTRPASATVRATASVRILNGASISWGQVSADLPKIRVARLRGADGGTQPIRLIEFE